MRSDDLVPLFGSIPPASVGYKQGLVLAWDPLTAQNTIMVDGGIEFTDLAILNTAEASILQPGDVVGILTTGRSARSWMILGRVTVPGTPAATSAYSAMFSRTASAVGTASLMFSGTDTGGFVTAATISGSATEASVSDVLIGSSGSCLTIVACRMIVVPNSTATSGTADAWVGSHAVLQSTGAAISPADVGRSLQCGTGWGGGTAINVQGHGGAAHVHWHRSLPSGLYTFSLRYRAQASPAAQATWFSPTITVIPL